MPFQESPNGQTHSTCVECFKLGSLECCCCNGHKYERDGEVMKATAKLLESDLLKTEHNTTIESILEEFEEKFYDNDNQRFGYVFNVVLQDEIDWLTQKLTEYRNSVIDECVGVVYIIDEKNPEIATVLLDNPFGEFEVYGIKFCSSKTIDRLNNLKV